MTSLKVTSVCDKGIFGLNPHQPGLIQNSFMNQSSMMLTMSSLLKYRSMMLVCSSSLKMVKLVLGFISRSPSQTGKLPPPTHGWGFTLLHKKQIKNYYTYQYAVDFEKMGDGTKKCYVYQYKSELAIAPGVQIRFLKDEKYDKKLVQTEPWKSG